MSQIEVMPVDEKLLAYLRSPRGVERSKAYHDAVAARAQAHQKLIDDVANAQIRLTAANWERKELEERFARAAPPRTAIRFAADQRGHPR